MVKTKTPNLLPLLSLLLLLSLSAIRLKFELAMPPLKGLGTSFDPRASYSRLEAIQNERESSRFKDALRGSGGADISWPGLSSLQASWTWLEVLNNLSNEGTYAGEYSWLFSKLNTILLKTPPKELWTVAMLSPYFFMMAENDKIGGTILMNELLLRGKNEFQIWFWSAYHAKENLKEKRLAGDLYKHAALFPQAPPYLASLSIRLSAGDEYVKDAEKFGRLLPNLPPELIEKLKKIRPNLF